MLCVCVCLQRKHQPWIIEVYLYMLQLCPWIIECVQQNALFGSGWIIAMLGSLEHRTSDDTLGSWSLGSTGIE